MNEATEDNCGMEREMTLGWQTGNLKGIRCSFEEAAGAASPVKCENIQLASTTMSVQGRESPLTWFWALTR